MSSHTSLPLIKRILRTYLRQHWRVLSVALVLMTLSALMTGALAKLMEPIVDDVFGGAGQDMILLVSGAVIAAFTLRGFASYGHTVLLTKVGQSIVAQVQRELFSHLIRADMAFFQEHSSGQLTSKMINDVNVMRLAVAESLTGMGKSFMTMVILIIVMFLQDWKLAIVSFLVFPLAGGLVMRLGKRLRGVSRLTQEAMGSFTAFLTQAFQSIRQVKAYGMEEAEIAAASRRVERLYKLACKAIRTSALSTPVSEVFSGLAIATVILYGGWQVQAGAKTAGELFAFITAFMLAYEPMKKLAKLNNLLQQGLAAAERVFTTIDARPRVVDAPRAKAVTFTSPAIVLTDVTFTYPDGTVALNGISLTVPAGKTAALVGSSGSGKSTILNVVPRFFDVDSGSVMIGDIAVTDITLESLRGQMALVSQSVALFDASIAENIRYSRPDATLEDVERAAKTAAAHDFITALPRGYETTVGEAGLKLSGGQRQRIAIARAILRDAPILLLDEATSALDSESEKQVQEAIERLQKDRTTLVIAHRLATIKNADIIYVLEDGKIAESGTHEALLAAKGIYVKLWMLQK